MRKVIALVFVSACTVEARDDATIDRGAVDPAVCEHIDEQLACLGAGCHWQLLYGVSLTSDGTCEIGPPWPLCYAPSFAQPCDDEALVCDDGLYAWVLPGPDDALVMTRSATSCGLPDYFVPCEEPQYRESLAAPDVPQPTDHAIDPLARACECGCAGPA